MDYEPTMATTDQGDGLTFYRKIAETGKTLLRQQGKIFVELGYGQSKTVANIFRERGYVDIDVVQDHENIDRVMKISLES